MVQTQNERLRPSDLFTEKQGNLKQMFVFTSRRSLGVLATDHSPAVISLLTSPHNPQHISALPTPMESRVGFCFGGFSGYKARLNVILSCDFGTVISLLASSS